MFATAFRSGGAGVQEGLDLLPRLRVNDGFVGAGIESALVAGVPDEVRVAQEFEERGPSHRLRWALRRRHGGESSRGGLGQQVGDGVLTLRVGVEHSPDQRARSGSISTVRSSRPCSSVRRLLR